jgi:holo-[acyl-carrier protein] synthase
MILGVGIDLIEVSRIKAMIRRHGEKFLARVFTPAERAYCERSVRSAEHYAARFAAKEAAMKALGTGLAQGIQWTDVEVEHGDGGRPMIVLRGAAAEIAAVQGIASVQLSLTHIATTAAAVVIAQGVGTDTADTRPNSRPDAGHGSVLSKKVSTKASGKTAIATKSDTPDTKKLGSLPRRVSGKRKPS